MQTTRNLVALAAELAACVQHGEHNFSCTLSFVWARWVWIDRNSASVVVDTTTAVGQQRDADAVAKARHRFVDRVVDYFPNEVVETSETR